MSTQDAPGIPLTHAPDGRGYKLMELPPELEALLTAEDAPVPLTSVSTTPRLSLTSTPDDAATLLVTPDKTYKLLQKNTSNSLILLAPHRCPPASGSDIPPVPGLAAIATVHETIELVAQAPEAASAASASAGEAQTKTAGQKSAGSKGKWHERFGRGR